jgi:RNA-directed DNA polymerase
VDDAVVHCKTGRQAQMLVQVIGRRMRRVGLSLHPDKTKIVYCRDGRRRKRAEHTAFTFLGYTYAWTQRQCAKRSGAGFVTDFHHTCALLKIRNRRYLR